MIQLIVHMDKGKIDISNLAESITLSGDYTQCARTLDFNVVSSAASTKIPDIDFKLGQTVECFLNGENIFIGRIFTLSRSTTDKTKSIICKDKGIYLKKNSSSYSFSNTFPEIIAKKICADFGIEIGDVAETNVPITRIFMGSCLYDILMTGYTLASKKNGKKYGLRFINDKLYIYEKKLSSSTLVLDGKSNLMSASYSETLDKMVNRIAVYNSDDNFVKYVSDDSLVSVYGVMQEVIKQGKDEDKTEEAKEKLFGIEKKVTVENLGDIRCITGNGIIVREPYTDLYGSFFIESDTHTFKNNSYFNKLTLNFENIMDKKEVGSLPKE